LRDLTPPVAAARAGARGIGPSGTADGGIIGGAISARVAGANPWIDSTCLPGSVCGGTSPAAAGLGV